MELKIHGVQYKTALLLLQDFLTTATHASFVDCWLFLEAEQQSVILSCHCSSLEQLSESNKKLWNLSNNQKNLKTYLFCHNTN